MVWNWKYMENFSNLVNWNCFYVIWDLVIWFKSMFNYSVLKICDCGQYFFLVFVNFFYFGVNDG